MNMPSFEGVVKRAHRGGWTARGVITDVAHSQLIETQVEPRAFTTRQLAVKWLKQAAAARAIASVRIVVAEPQGAR